MNEDRNDGAKLPSQKKISRPDGITRIVWVLLLMFFAQNAVASRAENEPRAALLYWMITAVVVLMGGIITLNQRSRLK